MKTRFIFSLLFILNLSRTFAQDMIPLYSGEIPNSKSSSVREVKSEKNGQINFSKVSVPSITPVLPAIKKEGKSAIIIVPGGGYAYLAYTLTGTKIAEYFSNLGVAAFILKYRLPDDAYTQDKKTAPIQDLQKAILWVKEHAQEYGIDTSKVGVLGSSAGGHLAAMASTNFKTSFVSNPSKVNLRPAFSILLYPAISFNDSLMHKGSRDHLLGGNPSAELVRKYSNELQVTPQVPPTFLVHAQDDPAVPVSNSIIYFQALTRNKVQAEMHIYPRGGHGFGVNNKTTPDKWLDRCRNWMIANGWITPSSL